MIVQQTTNFKNIVKKLHNNQKKELDLPVKMIIDNPDIGSKKVGDLSNVKVYKFKMVKQLTLLAYIYNQDLQEITFLYIGAHENFYRDLKNVL